MEAACEGHAKSPRRRALVVAMRVCGNWLRWEASAVVWVVVESWVVLRRVLVLLLVVECVWAQRRVLGLPRLVLDLQRPAEHRWHCRRRQRPGAGVLGRSLRFPSHQAPAEEVR